jgi:hypothetical protein
VGRERKDAGHTARSCFVWPRFLEAPNGDIRRCAICLCGVV